MSVEKEHVVDAAVALIELELTNRNRLRGGAVRVIAVLQRPARLAERLVDARSSLSFGSV
jgi:hypothetical protein